MDTKNKDVFNPGKFGFEKILHTNEECKRNDYAFFPNNDAYGMLNLDDGRFMIWNQFERLYSGKIPTNKFAKELFKNLGIPKKSNQ